VIDENATVRGFATKMVSIARKSIERIFNISASAEKWRGRRDRWRAKLLLLAFLANNERANSE
jgi:hypothetical protein